MSGKATFESLREELTERGLMIDALLRHAKGEYPRRRNPRTGRLAWDRSIRADAARQAKLANPDRTDSGEQ